MITDVGHHLQPKQTFKVPLLLDGKLELDVIPSNTYDRSSGLKASHSTCLLSAVLSKLLKEIISDPPVLFFHFLPFP